MRSRRISTALASSSRRSTQRATCTFSTQTHASVHPDSFPKQLSQRDNVAFHTNGYVIVKNVLRPEIIQQMKTKYEEMFAGKFENGIYPDEWHWRENMSLPDITREIVNGWKCDSLIKSVTLSEQLGQVVADLMNWDQGRYTPLLVYLSLSLYLSMFLCF